MTPSMRQAKFDLYLTLGRTLFIAVGMFFVAWRSDIRFTHPMVLAPILGTIAWEVVVWIWEFYRRR